ncbi:MAG: T9SS type A sorting domain-containing protein, partial [Bacteroidales bacterium]|nr:T9SS type A sorting domain-containing protein [Bacteroidales bacterium]
KLTFFILLLNSNLFAQSTKHVLFLGNSYTAANNLASIVASLALSTNDSLVYSTNTPGGYTLQAHSTNSASLALIQQGTWDYVVLQEQSQIPSWPISQVNTDMFPYAKSLCNSIRQANPCSVPLFFMTWGRKNGDSYNCPNWPPVCTYEGMDSLLNLRYQMVADSNDAYVSPVGAVWHRIRDIHNKIELYSSDESHPSLEGSYAAACTFYTLIFQKDPSLITDNYGLDASVAQNIRLATKLIAYDSLVNWNVGKYQPVASFSTTQINDSIYFSNNSIYATSYDWQFGDGTISSQFEPVHKYTLSGNYNVTLKANKCGESDTSSHYIQVVINTLNNSTNNSYSVYPNPIDDQINIHLSNSERLSNITIYSIDGKLIKSFSDVQGIDIKLKATDLPKGIYILSFDISEKTYQYKIVK